MNLANDILDAIEIIVDKKIKDNTAQIYQGICKSVSGNACTLTVNGKDNTVQFYGSTPTVGSIYRVFVPSGNMSMAFVIVPGTSGTGGGIAPAAVTSVNGKIGDIVLNADDVKALPNTTNIPTKISQLTNDSGYIGISTLEDYAKVTEIPVKTSELINDNGFITSDAVKIESVNDKIGKVVLGASDVGAISVDNIANTFDYLSPRSKKKVASQYIVSTNRELIASANGEINKINKKFEQYTKKIVIQKNTPEGLEAGDFWYQEY